MSPPILTHAAIFSFFFRVERDPTATADLIGATAGGPAPQFGFGAPQANGAPGSITTSVKPAKTSRPVLESKLHDQDFARLVSCVDPYSSRGLPSLFCKGQIAGSWEGRFSFFDFDSYRDMLGGRMRSLYEGPFGDQPQVWKLEEKIVKLEPGEVRGGTGPIVNAGYEIGQAGPRASYNTLSAIPLNLPTAAPAGAAPAFAGSTASSARSSSVGSSSDRPPRNRRPSNELGEGNALAGDARGAKRSRSMHETSWDEMEMLEEEDDESYEILLTGSVSLSLILRFCPSRRLTLASLRQGHSAWGQFLLKGRIRAYDGLFSLTKEYTLGSRGRWLYRGYVISGGSLVGRWRDTHSPIDMNGYEGTFLVRRRRCSLYDDH